MLIENLIKNKKEVDAIVNEDKINAEENKLKFNTYCFFTEEEKDVSQTIGLIFKDYIESLKLKQSNYSK